MKTKPHHVHYCSKFKPRREILCARRQIHRAHHHISWRHSPGYWHWSARVARREIASARYRIQHPPIAHRALWLCIHSGEGSWNDPNSGNNGHYGGLQMTSPWGRGDYYVYRADWLSPYMQMRKAELGFRASGYSRSWLYGQWAHPECMAYA